MPLRNLAKRLPRRTAAALVVLVTAVSATAVIAGVDASALGNAARTARSQPLGVAAAVAGFGGAFVLRAAAWRRVLPGLGFAHSLAGIHLALGGNHALPLRLGEPLRVLSVVRRAGVSLEAATSSTVALRSVDLATVFGLGVLAVPSVLVRSHSLGAQLLLAAAAAAAVAAWLWLRRLAQRRSEVKELDAAALLLSVAAWPAEAVLVWQAAQWAGLDVSYWQALGVTAASVAAQLAAIAPGGFGTYEAAAVAAYAALGHDAGDALVAALAAHGLKTAYSLAAGTVAVLVPSPSLSGRFRLSPVSDPEPGQDRAEAAGAQKDERAELSHSDTRPAGSSRASLREHAEQAAASQGDGPILLFMPAHNEAGAVADCVRRAPARVLGRRVQVLVVDDGSSDETAQQAAAAGAEVMSLGSNRGLGAAVRVGLAAGAERGAVAVAFCDADGEYPPEELQTLVAPILEGRADYVVGSRFIGRIHHMRPHRRLGNLVLTRALSVVARRRISDGQSGYRALSARAAAAAEIIHDYNYAQVLTLDLLAKGYRYAEVPISYRFRTTGQSFVKLGRYLRSVVPAVYRQVNSVNSAA
ncbi:MAG: lysylphosphatidylglycerol synthase domain-containing protein [Acidimicrobiaceae bacterium]|nr:lysylphosphatidylglycerol synthase domain-containing protein [Acidimicrobiaceae bacterium]MCY4279580.1 lysylphosphatidylglycerol synthase domain-containing protein [Acidimicrobiaceae bacterium]MCY4293497.1 lysylphosphatidylglycerol synthase domain-containing protein [Acidimicrobiaceae bacterium]